MEPEALLNPWTEKIDDSHLLEKLNRAFEEHLILPVYCAAVLSLWVLHTFVYDVFEYTPRIFFRSPTKRCGKTRCLKLLKKLVRKPLLVADATPASLFEEVHAVRPTLLLDEFDSMMYAKDLQNLFNSGYESHGQVRRKYGTFSTFTPIAIASITPLHSTMEDRSIVILLKRKKPEEEVKDPREFEGSELVSKCMRWANDHRAALEIAKPKLPAGLDDRAADLWTPLLAIADEVGGQWPSLARKAALALSEGREDAGREEHLLRDIREVLENDAAIFSEELVGRLKTKPDSPWSDLNEWTLSSTLANFSIRPRPIRRGRIVRRGYRRSAFVDTWERWL